MIPDKYVKDTCKFGDGSNCCSYLALTGTNGGGFICMKDNPEQKAGIDARRQKQTMTAMGDNCEGYFKNKTA